ncbi:MAG: helix-turn-helix domain-containing protein [Planctomycetota bacterium]
MYSYQSHDDSAQLLVDIRQASTILNMSERKIAQMVNENKIPSLKIGRSRRFCLRQLQRWIDDQISFGGAC